MKKVFCNLMVISLLVMILSSCVQNNNAKAENANGHIKSITAINEVFADGQKVSAVAVEYDKNINTSKLLKSDFTVEGKIVTKVYANTEAAKASQGNDGKYVILELATDYENPVTDAQSTRVGKQPIRPAQTHGPKMRISQPNGGTAEQSSAANAKIHQGLTLAVNHGGDGLLVSVKQVGNIETTDGEAYVQSSDVMENEKDINLVLDDFLKPDFIDPKNGQMIKYNLYVPQNYDKNKSYPLVLFIQDEGSINGKHSGSLIQGLGGIIWAEPLEQAKHECFVLAPSYHNAITTDNFQTTNELDTTVALINSLETQYNIDKNRIYTTGQSMGCMASIALNIKYPDMFAASLLVAGQWDPQAMSELNKANMWIVVSEGDEKSYSGMNDCMAKLEAAGAKICRTTWNGRASQTEFASDISAMIAEGDNIKYTILRKGTVVPAGQTDDFINNHAYTWRIAYTIVGVRDWLFTQVKTPNKL
ncbi:MAG: hypothetical protein H6Q67_837 [Firmicutes bacterium]|nr:hypothetical protein [Bacillota bacterium]